MKSSPTTLYEEKQNCPNQSIDIRAWGSSVISRKPGVVDVHVRTEVLHHWLAWLAVSRRISRTIHLSGGFSPRMDNYRGTNKTHFCAMDLS